MKGTKRDRMADIGRGRESVKYGSQKRDAPLNSFPRKTEWEESRGGKRVQRGYTRPEAGEIRKERKRKEEAT